MLLLAGVSGTSFAQSQLALPDLKTPGVQCTLLVSALDIQAEAELSAQQKVVAEREVVALLNPALQTEYGKRKAAQRKSKAARSIDHRVPAICAQVLYPTKRLEQLKLCGPSWRQATQVAAVHQHGLPRNEALTIAHTLSGTEGSKPSASDVKLVNFVYAHTPEAMRGQLAMLRVAGAWLDQCLVASE